ncbi:PREDICTED: clavesin-2 [Polistes dominula]|uniref:Clavesin-2 n=1 Tax=Polistes dominula TaxID=743375 RepID=A0ABM1I104_POLDO|nr:PREDICTED: clavesin-2 [Polistes dominula]
MSFELDESPIDEETKAIAVKELRETEENVQKGIETLRKYIEDDETLHFKTDDEFLIIFLRVCKYYPKSTYELIKRIADFKLKNASLINNLMPADEKVTLLEHNVVNVLKGRDDKRRRVLILNVGKSWDPSKVSADQIFRVLYLIHIAAIYEPETQVRGSVVIMDFDGLSMKQVMGLTPSFSMRLLTFIQDAVPMRLKEVHIVKQPFIFKMVWKMFSPFVREKLNKRLYFHGTNMSELHKCISPSHLPKNYGGLLPEIDYKSADWYPTIIKYEDRIREWNTFGYRKTV